MPLYLFYTMVQKSQKWPKTQIKAGGPALITFLLLEPFSSCVFLAVCTINLERWNQRYEHCCFSDSSETDGDLEGRNEITFMDMHMSPVLAWRL